MSCRYSATQHYSIIIKYPLSSTPPSTPHPLRKDAGPLANKQWCDTPLDFVEDHTPTMAPNPTKPPPPVLLKSGRLMGWNFWRRRARYAHIGSLNARPISRTPNNYNVAPSSHTEALPLWGSFNVSRSCSPLIMEFCIPNPDRVVDVACFRADNDWYTWHWWSRQRSCCETRRRLPYPDAGCSG